MQCFLSSESALDDIKRYRLENRRILGVDGFVIVGSGYVARIDLVLDLTTDPMDIGRSLDLAEAFIIKNSNENTVFEIVT